MKANKGRRPQEEKLILPNTFPSFLDKSKANTWRTIFENPAVFNARKKGNNDNLDLYLGPSPTLSNIFYLLQALSPGMLVIYHEYRHQDADVKVSRVLPRASWIESNNEVLSKMDALLAVAKDRKIAFHEERTAHPQNKSRNSSSRLPGTDALPAAAKDKKKASHKERKGRPRNNGPSAKVNLYSWVS
jgi:hypothetical protein